MENNQPPTNDTPINATPQPEVAPAPTGEFPLQSKPEKKRLPTIIVFAIIVFLLIVSSVAGYYIYKKINNGSNVVLVPVESSPTVTPIIDPTADWKTYTNSQYGYSFSYPVSNFDFHGSQPPLLDPAEGNWNSVWGCIPICEAYSIGFSVSSFENKNGWDLDTWLSLASRSPINKEERLIDCILKDERTAITEGELDTLPAKAVKYTIDLKTVEMMDSGQCKKIPLAGGGPRKYLITEHNGQIIEVTMQQYEDPKNNEVMDQILSTFKFIN